MTPADASALKHRFQTLLDGSIVPFWRRAEVSAERGCHVEFDAIGRPLPAGNRTLICQAGMLLYFSLLVRHTNDREAFAKACLLFDYIFEQLRDKEYGGYFWDAGMAAEARRGAPLPSHACGKHLCAQAYALSAISTFASVGGPPAAGRAAAELFDLILAAGRVDDDGLVLECLARDFTPAPDHCRSPLGPFGPDDATHATHIHLLRAIDAYRAFTGDAKSIDWTTRLLQAIVAQGFADLANTKCRFADGFDRSGHRRISVGHVLEEIWFSLAAERGIGRVPDYARYAANYRSLDAGYDERRGGFFFALVADATRYRDDRKFWWVQAEAIVCSLHLALLAADKLALDRLRATLRWIEKRHVDRRHGEWHRQPRRLFLRPDTKADNWKTADHPGRALIESLRLLGND